MWLNRIVFHQRNQETDSVGFLATWSLMFTLLEKRLRTIPEMSYKSKFNFWSRVKKTWNKDECWLWDGLQINVQVMVAFI